MRGLRVAARLQEAGVSRGDRVALCLEKDAWLPACHLGVLASGGVVVPINPALPDAGIAALLERSGAILMVSDPGLARRRHAIAPGLRWWTTEPPSMAGVEALVDSGDAVRAIRARAPGDLALLAFTSGTTGIPKGVPLSHGNLESNLDTLARVWEWSEADRLLHVLPVYHLHGLGLALYGSLLVGNAIVFHEKFVAERVLREAAEQGITMLMAVPTILHRLVEAARTGNPLQELRLVISGSAPLSADLFARFERRFGLVPVERYGMTETLMNTSNPVSGPRKPGSVGPTLPGTELRLRDPRSGADCGTGPGEIWVRGPNVFQGYWCDEVANREAFDEGWFRTGDLGILDEDGYVFLTGRAKELIVTGGFNVSPLAVEQALGAERDARIAELGIASVGDVDLGERVVAFVVLAPGQAGAHAEIEASLRARAEAALPRYARPREYRWVVALPRNALGKLQRAQFASAQVLLPTSGEHSQNA